MSIDFKINDFAYPIGILKFRSFLHKSQWYSEDRLIEYQQKRLKFIVEHCYHNVPYYHNLFDRLKLTPDDFKCSEDLKKIPYLTKDLIRRNHRNLIAKNFRKFNPYLCRSSGTTAEPIEFYLDKSANILEFCYYWRYWSWAGYKLGNPFAEFSIHHFVHNDITLISMFSPLTNRLILNPIQLSHSNVDKYVASIKKHKCRFLKGTPSIVHIFALLLERTGYRNCHLKAVFTTGEKLLEYQRKQIECLFNCKIFDSYGQMERTVAISQCSFGSYHIHSEYGIFEFEPQNSIRAVDGDTTGEIIGTSLHNLAMPLLRLKTGDLAVQSPKISKCLCGRHLPLLREIYGRIQDVVVTPDSRLVANIFVIFNFISGILWYQVIQKDLTNILVKVIKHENANDLSIARKIKLLLKKILGKSVTILVDFLPLENRSVEQKQRPVKSYVDSGKYI